MDQQNKLESPEINPHMYGQLSYKWKGQKIVWSRNGAKKTEQSWTKEQAKTTHYLTLSYTSK